MNGINHIRVTQYQKHLIKDLLEDNGISVIYDESMHSDTLNVNYGPPPHNSVISVTIRDLADSEFRFTFEALRLFQKEINGDIDSYCLESKIEKDKIYLGRSELSIFLHRNAEILIKMPYSYTPIYEKE